MKIKRASTSPKNNCFGSEIATIEVKEPDSRTKTSFKCIYRAKTYFVTGDKIHVKSVCIEIINISRLPRDRMILKYCKERIH